MPLGRSDHDVDQAVRATRSVRRSRTGATFTEVVVASSLLLIAIVPILKALTIGQTTSMTIERRTRSLALAQGKLDEIRARCMAHYDESFEQDSAVLAGAYLCNVADNKHASLRRIAVSVGYDRDGDNALAHQEVEVRLATYIARR